jgi:CBS domain-containing protein
MEQHQVHRLVVVEDGDDTTPIGVLSMTDLIHALAIETGHGGNAS